MADVYYKIGDDGVCYLCNEKKDGYQVLPALSHGSQPGGGYYTAPTYDRPVVTELTDGKFMFRANSKYIFQGATNETFDTTGWDMSEAEQMNQMFVNCTKLKSLDIGDCNARPTSVNAMFWGNIALEWIDLGNFDVSRCTDMEHMFLWVRPAALRHIYAEEGTDWSLTCLDSQKSKDIFGECSGLHNGNGVRTVYKANNTTGSGYFEERHRGTKYDIYQKQRDFWYKVEAYIKMYDEGDELPMEVYR